MYSGFKLKGLELIEKGYWVNSVYPGEKHPNRGGWQNDRLDHDSAVGWAEKEGYGVCILTGIPLRDDSEYSILAVDIDIKNEEWVRKLVDWCINNIGYSPERVGMKPKTLLVYKYRGENRGKNRGENRGKNRGERKKQVSGSWKLDQNDKKESGQKIEILGTGQQFVAYHIHKDTGMPYEWSDELVNAKDLCEITDNGIEALFDVWYEIAGIEGSKENLKKRWNSETGSEEIVGKSIPEMVIDLLAGNNLHDSLMLISQQMKYDGFDDNMIISHLKAYMNQSSAKRERYDEWKDRYDDIERIVLGAKEKISIEDQFEDIDITEIEDIEEQFNRKVEIPWPPGLFGELCEDAYNMAPHQYKEMAIVSALGLLAGIVGRKFNISGEGLNVYLTFLMRSGMGKDFIGKWINKTLNSLNPLIQNGSSFYGASRFTGPTAIYRSFMSARSQICVFTEAGLMLQSQAGDVHGATKTLLSFYTCSGDGTPAGKELFSKEENHLPPIMSPALSIISEATEATLFKAFNDRDSLNTGELARQSIFRINYDRPQFNHKFRDYSIRPACIEKLSHLHKKCAAIQAENFPNVHHFIMDHYQDLYLEMLEFNDELNYVYNSCRDTNPIKSMMSSRAYMKGLKYAAIISTYNNNDLILRKQEWDWSRKMVEYELNTVENVFAGGGMGNVIHDLMTQVMVPAIVKILKGEFKAKALQSSAADSQRGIFSKSALAQALKNNRMLNDYNDDLRMRSKPISGFDKVLEYMTTCGYIVQLDSSRILDKRMKCGKYKITDLFKTLLQID